ncbi:MAG TPA: DUF4037 domain-containing protein [Actinospica sp.]|jgi:hypothetical protein|nr:DUF4037 domain-containing protein [Actinospica sp.]
MAPTSTFIPGLELSRAFYAEVVGPILAGALGGTAYSAALVGWGSDVQGFDTERSTDHAWGPRLQVFLAGEDHREHAGALDELLERELPGEFRGHRVRFSFPEGAPSRHWVHVLDARDFFAGQLDADPADGGLSASEWLMVPAQVLRELTGGEVFHDGTGLLGEYRAALAWYPEEVWRYVLACQWMRLAQEEAFVGRCGEVGDELGSAIVAGRQVRDLMRLHLLMNRVYPPYSKWLGTAFAALPGAGVIAPALSDALAARGWKERERHLSTAYEITASVHNGLGLTPAVETNVRHYFTRPFQVIGATRFVDALTATISDPVLRELPPVGAIDQYVDNTDLTDHNHVDRRSRYIAGPAGRGEKSQARG